MSENIVDKEFLKISNKNGLAIWRIENFKLVPVEKPKYGTFYTGDSYLLLNTIATESNVVVGWNIHFWLGAESTQDEMTTAAYKGVELDDYLGGKPVQYREIQNHETDLFKSYFKNGIMYRQGGSQSGFKSVKDIQQEKKLYMVKGKRDVRVIEVPLEASSLNKSDVFILVDGLDIYQWSPPGSSRLEKMKANNYAKQIRDDECGGRAAIQILDDDWDTNEKFWSFFNSGPSDVKQDSDVKDTEFEQTFNNDNVKLYRISDLNEAKPSINQVSSAPLLKSMLDSSDCFIVDCGLNGIYTWIGKKCTKNEKLASINAAKELIRINNYPKFIPYAQLIDGGETATFKTIFSDWSN